MPWVQAVPSVLSPMLRVAMLLLQLKSASWRRHLPSMQQPVWWHFNLSFILFSASFFHTTSQHYLCTHTLPRLFSSIPDLCIINHIHYGLELTTVHNALTAAQDGILRVFSSHASGERCRQRIHVRYCHRPDYHGLADAP
jgi:hypothetical protein